MLRVNQVDQVCGRAADVDGRVKKKNKVASSFLIGCADSAIESHAAIVLLRVFHQVELREMPSVGSVTCKPLGL